MNVVTGASGIVGSHVLMRLLLENKPVTACFGPSSNNAPTKKLFSYYGNESLFEKIKWIEVDLLDQFSVDEALNGAKHVYHCAGLVSFNSKDRKKLFDINEKGTANVVNACLQSGAQLCFVSSVATINNADYAADLTEEVFWKKSGRESDYAISKYNAEREVWRGMEEGLSAVIVNPGVILSPGFWDQSSSRLFSATHEGIKYYTNGIAGYVTARDVAQIMILLMEQRQFGNRYILVEGNYSYQKILTKISEGLGKKAPNREASLKEMKFAYYLEKVVGLFTGKSPRISKPMIQSAFNKQGYSSSKIKGALKYNFSSTMSEIETICKLYLQERS